MKKLIALGLLSTMIITATGCASDYPTNTNGSDVEVVTPDDGSTTDESKDNETSDYYVSPTDEYEVGDTITVGDIMTFDNDTIHIISGDMVQVYNYDQSQEEDFYLNQKVSLIKGEQHNTLAPFITKDFSKHTTNMGHPLTKVEGSITEVTETTLTIESNNGAITVTTYEPTIIEVATRVTLYTMERGSDDLPSMVMLYNEDTKLTLTVSEIKRGPKGEMLLSVVDKENAPYEFSASGSMLEVNLSEILVGDELSVYHEGIMESYPMQIQTRLITRPSSDTQDDVATDDTMTNSINFEELIAKTYEATGLEFPRFMNQPLTKDNQTYMLGVDNFDFIDGLVSEPMMTSQAHSFVLFTVEEGADIDTIKADIKANVDGRKWICVSVEPENIIVDNIGQMIVLIMDQESEAIHNALLQVTQ